MKERILNELKKIISETFEIAESDINISSRLYEDLDLDSIDAIDLVVKLQDYTNAKILPDEFKTAKTVDDVVTIIANLQTK